MRTQLLIVAFLLALSSTAHAAATQAKVKDAAKTKVAATTAAKPEVAKSADGKLEADAKDKKDKSPFGANVGYSVSTDFAEELSPRLYRHNVSVGLSYKVNDLFSLSASTGYFFRSLNTSLSDFEEDSGISHISLGVSRSLSKKLGRFAGADHSLSAGLSGSLPMMEDDRIEGARGSLGIGPRLSSKFFDGLFSISNRVYYRMIFNKFDFSPVSNEPTSNAAYGWSIGSSLPIYGKLSMGFGFGIRRTRYTDGFHSFSYSNSQSLSYSIGSLSMSVSHSNGGYTDDGKVEFWYIDKYRRLVSASLGYSF